MPQLVAGSHAVKGTRGLPLMAAPLLCAVGWWWRSSSAPDVSRGRPWAYRPIQARHPDRCAAPYPTAAPSVSAGSNATSDSLGPLGSRSVISSGCETGET